MTLNSKISSFNQEVLTGSSKLSIQERPLFNKHSYMIENMQENSAFKNFLNDNKDQNKKEALENFKNIYKEYRHKWHSQPSQIYKKGYEDFIKNKDVILPLCIDIEIAAICDLACPHCFREYIITPDKIINEFFFYDIIDQISELKIPSIKLNWRGEPLLHPKIGKFIEYAKKKNILDVSINTNATNLSEKKSKELIECGLDQIIYSFDGGTKKTYEKMRPGRFEKNTFEKVIENIKNFKKIREQSNSKFPITKIQMILTEDSRSEIENFYSLFFDYVDDVTVTQYNERGGNLEDIDEEKKNFIKNYLIKNNLPETTPYIVDVNSNISISNGRISCEQLFQRMMITYDGQVGMCCHDWGAQHCIGFLSEEAFKFDETIKDLEKKIENRQKGFELLINAKKPKKFNIPKKEISRLIEIWTGHELNKVRKNHFDRKNIDKVEICKGCSFKDTYEWSQIR
jgi:MoaA/NifB/PqqE/SkfB family radical SAM enzyme